jgi:regulatory protein
VAGRRRRQFDSAGPRAAGGGRRAAGGPASATRAADPEPELGAEPYGAGRSAGGGRSAAERDADPEAVARQICLRMLTTAPRTQAQLAAAMRRRGVPEDAAAAVLARFAEVKLIDDAMFARAWVDSRHYGRGLASRALGAELRQRGVARDDIQAALSELSPDVELETARELVARRLPGTAGMPVPARIRRLVGVLARKGYSSGLAYRVVREALEAEAGDAHVPLYELADLPELEAEDDPAEV